MQRLPIFLLPTSERSGFYNEGTFLTKLICTSVVVF